MSSACSASVPPHCPNPGCDSHRNPGPWRFIKKGFYPRPARGDRIQRYRCQPCGRHFSSQTFSPTCWLRRPDLLRTLFYRIRGCSGLRQIAQELGVSPSTVQLQVERLGRHCLLFHEQRRPGSPSEELVLDGFRTLESGHYWPFDLNLLIGQESHYVYGFNDAELRRGGTMRPGQRRHRTRLEGRHGRPDPQATRKAIRELVARVVPPGATAVIHSDEHPSYGPALRDARGRTIHHRRTSSRLARTHRNPLFAINLADLLLRHGSANHKRETIAFSKRRQGALYRAWIWVVWRNYIKWSSERKKTPPPAVRLGILPERLSVDQLLSRRLFPWRQRLGPWLRDCYTGRIRTRCLAHNRVHALTYAV